MRRTVSLLLLFLIGMPHCEAQTTIPPGDVIGTWSPAGSPYIVTGDIIIPSGFTLTVEPGVVVSFAGHYRLNVQGRLLAEGSPEDTITFTAGSPTTGWAGIRFTGTPPANDSSRLRFCKLEYGRATSGSDRSGGALFIHLVSKLLVSHCLLTANATSGDLTTGGGAIAISSCSPRIENNLITGNTATGGHGGGILIGYAASSPVINNNIITANSAYGGGGVANAYCTPALANNTIAGNAANHGGALDCIDAAPSLLNTIIWGNTASVGNQVHLHGSLSQPGFYHCNVQGGTAHFARDHMPGGTFTGPYIGNLDLPPLFTDSLQGSFALQNASPCIGAGVDSIYDTPRSRWLRVPIYDCVGVARPQPAGSAPDLGARESPLGTPVTGTGDRTVYPPLAFRLEQNYPNPFNPATRIAFSAGNTGRARLQVYDALGALVVTLFDGVAESGRTYEAVFEGGAFCGGVYFYRLTTEASTATRKLVLLR